MTEPASAEAVKYLGMHLIDGLGALGCARLIDHFGDVDRIRGAPVSELRGCGIKAGSAAALGVDNSAVVAAELRRVEKMNARVLCRIDPDYPALLKTIADPPVCLYVQGQLDAAAPTLAIVGSRKPTSYGLEQAYRLGMEAARTGLVVASGLARGIDCRAHQATIVEHGRAVAVLGCGLAELAAHPNRRLAQQIIDCGGAIITELAVEQTANKGTFPARNRIIAGMAAGTIVVEAAVRSGALITARLAAEYDREVFAVPGLADNPVAAGTLQLIQRGEAKLITRLEHVLEELGPTLPAIRSRFEQRAERIAARTLPAMSADERAIFDVLDRCGVDLERICEHTALPPARISSCLVTLQLKGAVEQLPGNRFAALV